MRCTQPYGLPSEANDFLMENAVRVNECEHCNRFNGFESKEIGRVGMFDDLPLLEYKLKDGRTAKEYVQCEIWSSGPMIWFGLEVSDGTSFVWDMKDIKE